VVHFVRAILGGWLLAVRAVTFFALTNRRRNRDSFQEVSIMKNRIIKTGITLLALNSTLAATVFAAEPSATPSPEPTGSPQVANSSSSEIRSVTQLDEDYEAAYNRGDANAVAAFYTDDAEYVDEGGNVVSGRRDIEKLLVEEFTTNPGAQLKINVESIRLLSPDVLVEKGIATITARDRRQGTSRYIAIYTKPAGNWKISQLTQTQSREQENNQ
jgi:uncharacterized protein (TIGR02246 family)